MASSRVLHVTGITPSLSSSAERAVRHAVTVAHRHGVAVSFDVNHRATLPRHRAAAPLYRDLAARATIVFAGLDEAELLTPGAGRERDLLAAVRAMGPTQVILKQGPHGCAALIDDRYLARDAVAVDVVDTVGAGDAFVAGYLSELALGRPPEQRLHTAVWCGAFACTGPGDWEGSPRRAELDRLGGDDDPVLR